MTHETVLSMWNAVRDRFTDKANALSNEDVTRQLGETSIGKLLYHTAEVEYMFADWYFSKSNGEIVKPALDNKDELIAFLAASNTFLKDAMKDLPEEKWFEVKETRMGKSTPLEIIGRLIYHTGIHAGQITDIQKFGE